MGHLGPIALVASHPLVDLWSTSVATRQSSCEHGSMLAAPSVLVHATVVASATGISTGITALV